MRAVGLRHNVQADLCQFFQVEEDLMRAVGLRLLEEAGLSNRRPASEKT